MISLFNAITCKGCSSSSSSSSSSKKKKGIFLVFRFK